MITASPVAVHRCIPFAAVAAAFVLMTSSLCLTVAAVDIRTQISLHASDANIEDGGDSTRDDEDGFYGVQPVTFRPSQVPTSFRFLGSTVNITNATTEAEACGFICPGRVDGEAINGTLYLYNASTPSLGNRLTARCSIVVGNTTSETQVCTAYIRYNASYIENGTVYALPMNKTVMLDPRTRVISLGYTFPLWLWIELSECPWYYNNPSIHLSNVRNDSSIDPVNRTGSPPGWFDIAFREAACEVAFHAERSTQQARIVVNATASFLYYEIAMDEPLVEAARKAQVRVVLLSSAFGGVEGISISGNNVTVLDVMNVSMSPSWWPMENYSVAPLATQPRRCYATDPRAADGSPSTVWEDRTACTVYPGYVVGLHLEFLNATALCCSMPNVTSVVWPSPIEVWVRGERWFVDNAGIAGDASPTAAPGSGGVPPRNYSNTSAPSSPPDAATEAPQGSRSGDGGGESAALVIGVALAAVGGVIAMGAVLYTAVWKRYRAPEEAKAHRDDALRDVMGDHTDEGGASGALEAELLAACGDL